MQQRYTVSGFVLAILCATSFIPDAQAQAINGASESPPTQSVDFAPNILPQLTLRRVRSAITIDGEIDENAWRVAARAANFSETFPGDQTQPDIDIAAFMTYDDEHLYIAYRLTDDPSAVRANLSDRDAIWQDDYVGLLLDPNGDGQSMYFIASNPLGIQGDSKISPNNEDEGFDIIYQSEGMITDTGYQVEMAIPFKSLRFPNQDEQTWRATFWITRPRGSRNTYSWAAISRDNPCWSCQLGTIRGINNVRSGRNLEILPAITGAGAGALNDAADPRSGFNNTRIKIEPSLNIKHGITSALTVDATINPDFSQIESDAAQIDVNSTFALFFEERRPFFQEGADLFDTEIRTVYTRSINDPIAAAKLTGRFGATSVAYIGARDNTSPLLLPFEESSELVRVGKSISNIMRVKHSFADNSHIGALVTDRRLDKGGAGSTVGVDGALRMWKNYILSAQFVASRSAEPMDATLSEDIEDLAIGRTGYTSALDGETFWGQALSVELDRDSRYWSFEVGYEDMSPTFRADNGFVRQNNRRRLYMWQGVTLYPEKVIHFIDRIRPSVVVGKTWDYYGVKKSEFLSSRLSFQMKGQTYLQMRYSLESERFQGVVFDGLRQFSVEAFSNFSELVRLGFEFSTGRDIARSVETPEVGSSLGFSVFGSVRPTQRLKIEPRFVYSRLTDRESGDKFFSGYIARMRLGYQFTRRVFLRTVVQYNQFSEALEIDPLFTYKLNAFTHFHVGSTHDLDRYDRPSGINDPTRYFRQSSRQIFFKFQYFFRR